MADDTTPTGNPPPAPPPTPAPAPPVQTVPLDRFEGVVRQRDEARALAASLQEEAAALKGKVATVDTITGELTEAKTRAAALEERFGLFGEVTRRGINEPEIFEVIEQHWRKLPASSRPKLGEMLDGWKSALTTEGGDPSAVPLLIRPHLASAWKPPAAADPPAPRGGHAGHPYVSPPGGGASDTATILKATQDRLDGRISMEEFNKIVGPARR